MTKVTNSIPKKKNKTPGGDLVVSPAVGGVKPARGLVIIFYGKGKGKTSAALGIVLRASGYQLKTLIYQFVKGNWTSGEKVAIEKYLPKVKIKTAGLGFVGILDDKLPKREHIQAAKKAFEQLKKEVASGDWDIVALDEILGTVKNGLIKEKEVIELIQQKPSLLHLILTGHSCPKSLIKLADLVTDMKEIKHPFKKGRLAEKGIDY